MFVTNWISTTKIQKISEITNFFRHYFLSRTEVVDKKTGLIVQHHQWGDLGDWLSPSYEKDDKSLVWECYFIFDLDILSQMAKALGKTEDAAWLTRLANERRAFFRKTFVDEATGKTICSWYDALSARDS